MSQQKITPHFLLDLSAVFNTIDHSILIHRLSSWFGLNGTVLSWLQSYLSSRNFIVNIRKTLSAPFSLHKGVPQGSVLGPLHSLLHSAVGLSKSYFMSFPDLRRIRNTLDSAVSKTIAASLIHSMVNYCNSLFLNHPRSQLAYLQLILNSAA